MNLEVVLLIAISLLVKFGDCTTRSPAPPKTTFRGTFVKGEAAERIFAEQLRSRNALIEAARAKMTRRQKRYRSKTIGWKAYQRWRFFSARDKLKKLEEKYEEPKEAFCDLPFDQHSNICKDAFQNPYFKEENLAYPSYDSPNEADIGSLITKVDGQADPVKYKTKFKKCIAEKVNGDASKTTINVYLKASDKWKKGRRLKFFVILASDVNPGAGILDEAYYNLLLGKETQVFKVVAYLENKNSHLITLANLI